MRSIKLKPVIFMLPLFAILSCSSGGQNNSSSSAPMHDVTLHVVINNDDTNNNSKAHHYTFQVFDINNTNYDAIQTKCASQNICEIQTKLAIPYNTSLGTSNSMLVMVYDNNHFVGIGGGYVDLIKDSQTYYAYIGINQIASGIYLMNKLLYSTNSTLEIMTGRLAAYWGISAPTFAETAAAVYKQLSQYTINGEFASPDDAINNLVKCGLKIKSQKIWGRISIL